MHLQSTLTSQDALAAKWAFEAHCRNHGVTVKQYHADNGRFADNIFINDCKAQGQTITYCGVNAHWQNGLAEKGIRDGREAAKTMLLHAIHRWPSAVTIHLWPYALRYAAHIFNNTPFKDGISPMENFSSTNVCKSTVICVVLFNRYTMISAVCLKCSFRRQRVLRSKSAL